MCKTFKYTFFAAICWLISFCASGQEVRQINRVEVELDLTENSSVHAFGKNGIIMKDYSIDKYHREVLFKYSRFNTDLKNEGEKRIAVRFKKGRIISYNSDALYTLVSETRKGNVTIVSVSPQSFEIKKLSSVVLPKLDITDFMVADGKAYICGIYRKQPRFAVLDMKSQTVSYISLGRFESKDAEIEELYLAGNGQVHLLLNYCENRRQCQTVIFILDDAKKTGSELLLSDVGNQKISSAHATPLSDGSQLVAGTFSKESYDQAKGIYMAKYTQGRQQFIQFYNFLDLKNFLNYLPKYRQEKIERKYERKKRRGKDYKLEYQILIHDIIEREQDYLFIGEAYYPTYRTVTTTNFVNGVPVVSSYQVFDGYQFTHTVVVSFDAEGKMNWSNTFKMQMRNRPMYLKKNLTITTNEEAVNFLFCDGARIISTQLSDGKFEKVKDADIVKTGRVSDDIKWTSSSEVEYWYDNFYITYGSQKIKDSEKSFGNRTRKVFYINKIQY